MLILGKSLTFEEGHIEDLVDTPCGSPRLFPLLALLYAGTNVQQAVYHVDHIFPQSRFTQTTLKKDQTVDDDKIELYLERFDLLPNLQLLEGTANVAKQAMLPAAWWREAEPNPDVRAVVFAGQDMTELPETMAGFLEFYELHRERRQNKLRTMLDVKQARDEDDEMGVADELAAALN